MKRAIQLEGAAALGVVIAAGLEVTTKGEARSDGSYAVTVATAQACAVFFEDGKFTIFTKGPHE